MVGAQERLPDVAGHQGDAKSLGEPRFATQWGDRDTSYRVSELRRPLRQRKVTPGRAVLRSEWVRGQGG